MTTVRFGWLALAVLLAGCGAAQPVASTAPASAGAASLDSLYQQAKAEGQLSFYSSSPDAVALPLVQAFEKQYPGIKVDRVQKAGGDLTNDVRVQQAAHHVEVDVAHASDVDVANVVNDHMPTTIDWVKLGVPADRVLDNQFVHYQESPTMWVYNTKQVQPAGAPKSWDDLLDPKWTGKEAVDGRASPMGVFLSAPELGGPSKGLEYAKKVPAIKPLFQASGNTAESAVTSGEAWVGTVQLSSMLAAQKKGAPLAIAPVSPVLAISTQAYVPQGAPHMAAAQLFVVWLASPGGQAALEAVGYGSEAGCGGQGEAARALCSAGVQVTRLAQMSQYMQLADFLKQVQQAYGTYVGK